MSDSRHGHDLQTGPKNFGDHPESFGPCGYELEANPDCGTSSHNVGWSATSTFERSFYPLDLAANRGTWQLIKWLDGERLSPRPSATPGSSSSSTRPCARAL